MREDQCTRNFQHKKLYYTNIEKVEISYASHDKVATLIKTRSEQGMNREQRSFKTTPKNIGPDTKLLPKEKYLMTLMKS